MDLEKEQSRRSAGDAEDDREHTNTGTIIRLKVDDISVLGRSTQGVTLMRTNDGGKVVSVEILSNEVPEDDGQTTIEETE